MRIISWFTENTKYQNVIKDYFIDSVEKLNLNNVRVFAVPSKNNWKENTNLKPDVALNALKNLKDDVLLVDADATILEYPKLIEEIPEKYDCAMFWLDWNEWYNNGSNKKELCSGTLFFRDRLICEDLILTWKKICENNSYPDQKNLELALQFFPDLKIYELPLKYCYITTMPNGDKPFVECKNPIITHHQVSRELRRKING